jgi:hypothetical protein
MAEKKIKKRIGIAAMFTNQEIKEYFNTFLILIGGIEFVILFAHFIGSTGQNQASFPWKHYLFVSFIAPVLMVAVIGLIVVGFNFYMFGDKKQKSVDDDSAFVSDKEKKFWHSSKYLFSIVGQIPVLAGFFILCLGSLFLYKLDVIVNILGLFGERTIFYFFIALAFIVVSSFVFLLCWLFWKFRLRKIELQNESEFKKRVIETTGLIILDNNVVLDKNGNIVTNMNLPGHLEASQIESSKNFLPEINNRLDFK